MIVAFIESNRVTAQIVMTECVRFRILQQSDSSADFGSFFIYWDLGLLEGYAAGSQSQVAILLQSSGSGTPATHRLDACDLQEVCQDWIPYCCFMTP